VLRRFDSLSLLDLTLSTGRTHQIRVHLTYRGHPVFGDPVYGGTARALQRVGREQRPVLAALAKRLSRQALHAYHLAFRHPVGGARCRFEAPVPTDMDEVLAVLVQQESSR
jgi:23S rRNA pseudouridine1911/1915/1917 synthase